MKISKQRLKQIIKEELSSIMYEGDPDSDGDDAAELRDMADQLEGGGKTYPQAEMESTMSMKVPTQELKRVEFLAQHTENVQMSYALYVK